MTEAPRQPEYLGGWLSERLAEDDDVHELGITVRVAGDAVFLTGVVSTEAALDRTITVRFDTNVRDLPWTFQAEEVTQQVQIGAQPVQRAHDGERGDQRRGAARAWRRIPPRSPLRQQPHRQVQHQGQNLLPAVSRARGGRGSRRAGNATTH